jgi:heterodisulfide reductase subunit C/quinone-modifying oxidoreductase subunit QmoC
MRTLRRYLTGQYDWSGLSSRILSSRAWHLGSLAFVATLVFALLVVYHLYWVGLPVADFATTSMGLEHMFPKILYFTWIVYALPALLVLSHAYRMQRLTMGRAGAPMRLYLAEAGTILVHMLTHKQMRKCPAEAREARAYERWLRGNETPGVEVVPRRWLKHWLMALGTVMMVVLTAAFLRWFQTDSVYPLYHPQRWLGYLAAALILWGTTDILWRRLRTRGRGPPKRALSLPLLLWLTAVSGIAVHVLRCLGLELATHYAYAVHLVICVPMIVIEVPFGEWAHMIDRPLALYFQAVRERAREELPAEGGLEPARA